MRFISEKPPFPYWVGPTLQLGGIHLTWEGLILLNLKIGTVGSERDNYE